MWSSGRFLAVGLAVAGLCGCNIGVQLTASSIGNGDVVFNLKTTNLSVCPVARPDALVLPFLDLAGVFDDPNSDPNSTLEDEIQQLLDAVCTGEAPDDFPDEISCEIVNNQIICIIETNGNQAAGSSTGTPSLSAGVGPLRFTCDPNGNGFICRLPLSGLPSSAASQSATDEAVAASTVLCPDPAFCFVELDGPDVLPPGGMATANFVLPQPPGAGSQNFAFPIPNSDGVCGPGAAAGMPCEEDVDCPGSACRGSICVDGSTPGVGCVDSSECGSGTCISCFPEFTISFACGVTTPVSFAPALSPWNLTGLVGLLGAVGAYGLFRLRRRGSVRTSKYVVRTS
jgi:hypothetical protein